MRKTSLGALSLLILLWRVMPAAAQVEPPYDPEILPQEYTGPPLPVREPDSLANSGAARLSCPLAVPPGRRGLAPRLSLEYNSGARNGIAGVGWSLSLGAIRRATRNGLNYAGTAFEHDGQQLSARPDWGAGFYGAKREERFSKYQMLSASSGWVVTARDGTRYRFGSHTGSRQENLFGVFQWCLDRVEDANGNYYLITYFKDQGQIYPAWIAYTGNGRLNPTHSVEFSYESRPDVSASYLTKTRVVTARRLAAVTTRANGQPARTYALVYENGPSGRSRLKQVKADPLPPATFLYQEGGDGSFALSTATPTQGGSSAGFVFHGPCDSDGYADLIKFNSDSLTPYAHVYLSDGAGGFGGRISTRLAGEANTAGLLLVADFDADGSVDIVKAERAGFQGAVFFHRGLGNGAFAPAVRSELGGGANDRGRLLLGDVLGQDGRLELIKLKSLSGLVTVHRLQDNGAFAPGIATNLGATVDTGRLLVMDSDGDRRDDLVRTNITSRIHVHLSRGDGTFAGGIENDLGNGPNDPGHLMTGDFNGDGLSDLLKLRSLSSRIYVHLSFGTGAFGPGIESDLKGPAIDAGRLLAADVDHDGNLDILRHYYNSAVVDCYLSEGDGVFRTPAATALGTGPPAQGALAASNIDGAGGADLVLIDRFGKATTFTAAPDVPDLLIRTTNGLGALYSFCYRSSAQYENHYLPFHLETLAAVSVDDGNGVASTRGYSYSGGAFDPVDAEFRGFEKTEETLPDGTSRKTMFHLDEYRMGREQQVEHRGPADRLLSRTEQTWTAEPLQGAARFVQLSAREEEHFFDPSLVRRWDYVYSRLHGGVLSCTQSGSGAEAITTSSDYRNCGFWNWRISRETLADGNGAAVRDAFFSHDSSGNRTVEERWNDGGDNPTIRWTYDHCGNPASRTDARGHATTYEYDALTFTYPSKITLPRTGSVSHVWKAPEIDYRVGKATVLEDENGNRTLHAFDSLGRLLQADYPDGGRTSHAYVESSFPAYVKTTVHNGSAAPIVSHVYFDGLGRRIRTVASGERGRPIHSRWLYDKLGRNCLREGPFFAGSNDYSWTETGFDFWSRPVSVRRPGGEHGIVMTTFAYRGLDVTETDPDGASKTTSRDYLDRVTRVVEHSEQGDIATTFGYNAAGELLRITHPAGVSTRFERNSLGNIVAMSDPDMGAWQYAWDANGNLSAQTDAKGQSVSLEYDPLNRIVAKSHSSGDPPVVYTYDSPAVLNGIGRLHTAANPSVAVSYDEYDEMGRVLAESRSFPGLASVTTLGYEFDPAGNRTAVTYPVDGYRVSYSYHPGTRLIHRVTGPGAVEFAEFDDYTEEGKPGFLYHGNGTSTTFAHDRKSGALRSIRVQAPSLEPADDIFHRTYRHTPGGDIREITDELRGSTRYYAYDKLHRLISETSSSAALVHPSKIVRLKYDYVGPGPFHAPRTIELHGNAHSLRYDANGNLVDGPAFADPQKVTRRAFTHTVDNMPARVDQPGLRCTEAPAVSPCPDRVEILYDGANKRALKRSAAGTTYYVGRLFELRNGLPVHHIFAGDLRLAEVTSSGIRHFHKDHLMSTVAATDEAGQKAESMDHIPFGQSRRRTGQWATAFRYTDQEFDWETGLYNYKARLYDPLAATFTTPDPFLSANLVFPVGKVRSDRIATNSPTEESANSGTNAFAIQQMFSMFSSYSKILNRYAYVQNNPINFIDPRGLHWQFSQSSGDWTYVNDQTGETTYIGPGYSGTGEGRNNPQMQDVRNIGPIPQGTYDIGPGRYSPNTGPNSMNLEPRPETNTYNRSLFRIHGDNVNNDASEGCPIAGPDIRRQINNSNDRVLEVIP